MLGWQADPAGRVDRMHPADAQRMRQEALQARTSRGIESCWWLCLAAICYHCPAEEDGCQRLLSARVLLPQRLPGRQHLHLPRSALCLMGRLMTKADFAKPVSGCKLAALARRLSLPCWLARDQAALHVGAEAGGCWAHLHCQPVHVSPCSLPDVLDYATHPALQHLPAAVRC